MKRLLTIGLVVCVAVCMIIGSFAMAFAGTQLSDTVTVTFEKTTRTVTDTVTGNECNVVECYLTIPHGNTVLTGQVELLARGLCSVQGKAGYTAGDRFIKSGDIYQVNLATMIEMTGDGNKTQIADIYIDKTKPYSISYQNCKFFDADVNKYTVDVNNKVMETPSISNYTFNYSAGAGGSITAEVASGTSVPSGTIVKVTATPEAGYTVSEWSDDGTVTDRVRFIEVKSNLNITVTFARNTNPTSYKPTKPTEKPGEVTNPNAQTPDPKTSFTDVKVGMWYEDAVKYVNDAGFMKGVSTTSFQPNVIVSRAMLATTISRLGLMMDPDITTTYVCRDVKPGQWFYEGVEYCLERHIMTGTASAKLDNGDTDVIFTPNVGTTREQVMAVLGRIGGADISNTGDLSSRFADFNTISDYAKPYIYWCVQKGIVKGSVNVKDGKTYINPKTQITRAELAQLLLSFFKVY